MHVFSTLRIMRFLRWLKHEFFHVLPAFLFFYISFNLINFTQGLMIKKAEIQPFGFITIFLAAGVVAKVLIAIDFLPVLNAFPRKPLIYNVIWKTILYSLATLLVRLLDRLWNDHFGMPLHWTEFWAIQIWYVILFVVFVAARELTYKIGPSKVRQMFFGK